MTTTIENVASAHFNTLCNACGTCQALCPNSAIKLERRNFSDYRISLNETKCTKCGLCYEVCPGHTVDFSNLNEKVYGNEPKNQWLGNYIESFLGFSNNPEIRNISSSGGMITQLLSFGLEEEIIDGALVTRMNKNNPLEPEPFIARTVEEIKMASKSKYCPVPANIALKEIMRSKGNFAVVGLPCHIHGIRKAESKNLKLKKKIALHLGLLCVHTESFGATELLLEKFGIKRTEVRALHYRGGGWPGNLSVELVDGSHFVFQDFLKNYWNPLVGPSFFSPLRCMCCIDHTNELSDLSFGDAWLKDIVRNDRQGTSIIISRTKVGEKFLQAARSAGIIELKKVDPIKVFECQRSALYSKKVISYSRMLILEKLGFKIPRYSARAHSDNSINYLLYISALLQLINSLLSQRVAMKKILKFMPHTGLRFCSGLMYYIERSSSHFPPKNLWSDE